MTWRRDIENHLREYGETIDDIVFCTLTDEEMDQDFDTGYGSENGKGFRAWTKTRVLFPVCYDGCEWVESILRNPGIGDVDQRLVDYDIRHIGGG